ncbi:Uncharacterized protein PBTT_07128 [Plasmodiophora brassicae]|uniref:Uncharacterized protein n=1 Tax=Plasmodiophora brassicae TaxID=37360 RepID=A0A0G4J8U2_PLABS|nr:hypothetical protein PBRA_003283 [Plasmodiophora brassicae]SPQ99639.1 unnamed protein product [Plasmodiophora brassicae]
MTMLLDLVRGLLLAPVYVVLSAAALLQMRDGLDKLTSFVRDPAAGPTGIVLTIKPVLVHIEAFLVEAFGPAEEFRFNMVHVLLFAMLMALISLPYSGTGTAKSHRRQ